MTTRRKEWIMQKECDEMTYYARLFRMISQTKDESFRLNKAEEVRGLWKITVTLSLVSMIIYGIMAFLGVGSEEISKNGIWLSSVDFEASKLWFVLGRMVYGLLFAAIVIFLPSLLFYLLTGISYKKLIIIQHTALIVFLIERLLWIPLALLAGLSWYVSPLSFGIIASYITNISWIVYFFGAISLFQLWIIYFQANFLAKYSDVRNRFVWLNVILIHFLGWVVASVLANVDSYIISGWFG
ncbi:hypothetical protein [Oceanobacillus kimchii]|nr:hypothetical protein [Oceanobacillus kimchii]